MFIFVVLGTHPYTLHVIFTSVNDDSVNVTVFGNASLSLSEVWLYINLRMTLCGKERELFSLSFQFY